MRVGLVPVIHRVTRSTMAAILVVALAAAHTPAAAAPSETRPSPGRVAAHEPTGRVIMRFVAGATAAERIGALSAAGITMSRVQTRSRDRAVITPPSGVTPAETARRLAEQAVVAYAAPEGRVRALGALVPPDDTRYASQALYLGDSSSVGSTYSIDLEPAWDQAFNGASHTLVPGRSGVTIAIVDSGVGMPYLETTGEFTSVWDYVEGDAVTDDDNGHGTRVASIIRGKTANTRHVAGVLHSSKNQILVFKVLAGSGVGDTDDAIQAIMDAADRGAKIINCSLGESIYDGFGFEIPGLRAAYTDAVRYAGSRGAVVVAASGNYAGYGAPWSFTLAPALVPDAIAVGSISAVDGSLSAFTNYGPGSEVDVVAPGESIWGMNRSGTSSPGDGTSYATPLVSGSLGLLWSLASDLPSATVTDHYLQSCPTWPAKSTSRGYGIPDVWSAYQAMIAGVPEQAAVVPSATAPSDRVTTVSWSPATGTGVSYAYGEIGGPEYSTSLTSGQLVLSAEGTRTVYVRSFAKDRWSHQTTVTIDVVTPPDGLGPLGADRRLGASRYDTAVDVSRSQFPTTAPAVVIASGRNWPDALSAAPLAAAVGGPLLLTDPTSLTIATRDEIWRLAPSRVFIVGGAAAIDVDVELQLGSLQSGDTVTRLAGTDRYATARAIANQVAAEGGGVPGGRAFVCSGTRYPDALSGAAVAAAAGQPILLTYPTALPSATSGAIASLGITDTVVLGGVNAVSAAVYALLPSPERVAGADRYATSREVADWATGAGLLDPDALGVARGDNYPDALAAGGRMAALNGPLLLVPLTLDTALHDWLTAVGPSTSALTVFGGPGAVSYGLENDARRALREP